MLKSFYKGRAYQCRKCLKVDRKCRTIAHILKHHVPFDQVPYSCSLCSFRCQDKATFVSHITRYKRHQEEMKKAGGKVDHSKVLNRSSNPCYVTDGDMVVLNREESGRRFSRQEDLFDDEDMFEEDEDGELSLPSWAKDDPLVNPSCSAFSPQRTPTFTLPMGLDNSPVQPASNIVVLNIPDVPQMVASTFHGAKTTATTVMSPPLQLDSHFGELNTPKLVAHRFQGAPADHNARVMNQGAGDAGGSQVHLPAAAFQTINLLDLNQPTQYPLSAGLGKPAGARSEGTPLLDERSSLEENLLPELLRAAPATDPLMSEIEQGERAAEKRKAEVKVGDQNKKPRKHQETIVNMGADYSLDIRAVEKVGKELVDAIDRNTRAIRSQDQTFGLMVERLEKIERVLSRRQHQERPESRDRKQEKSDCMDGKENKPVLVSVIAKKNNK